MGETRGFAKDPTLKKPSEVAPDDQAGFSPAEEKWFAEFQDDSYHADPEAMAKVAESDRAHAEYKKRMKAPDAENPATEPKKRYSQEEADAVVGDLVSAAARLKKEAKAGPDTKPSAQNEAALPASIKEAGIKLEVLGNHLNFLRKLQSTPDDNAEKQLHMKQLGFANNPELETRIDQVQRQIAEAEGRRDSLEKEHKDFSEIAVPTSDEKEHGNADFDQAAWFADEDEAPRVVERITREKGEQHLTPEDLDKMNQRL